MTLRLLSVVAAAAFAVTMSAGTSIGAEPIKIGASLPLTGGFSVTGE